jgi:hypothetical protein
VETELEPEEPYPDYITQDTSMETGFYGTGPGPSAQEGDSTLSSQSLLGKLFHHCPSLFHSLSLMEREALNSSKWILSSMHCASVFSGMGGEDLTLSSSPPKDIEE